MEKTLDLSLASWYNLKCDRDRILNISIKCTYPNAIGVDTDFDFSPYTYALLVIKNSSGTIILTFSTDDGSISFQPEGILKLYKTSDEMNTIRAGVYDYDMYISSVENPKRAFLRGTITVNQNTAN